MMKSEDSEDSAVCCLCGKSLALRTALVLVLNSNIDSQDASQNLYTHPSCLKNHLAIGVPLISELRDPLNRVGGPPAPSEDRQTYERHLAQAARMFEAIRSDPALEKARAI